MTNHEITLTAPELLVSDKSIEIAFLEEDDPHRLDLIPSQQKGLNRLRRNGRSLRFGIAVRSG